MIHTFTALGQYLVADVNSGAVHVLDRMSYDLLLSLIHISPRWASPRLLMESSSSRGISNLK